MVDDGVRFASVLGGELLHVLVDLRGQPAKVIHAQACPPFFISDAVVHRAPPVRRLQASGGRPARLPAAP